MEDELRVKNESVLQIKQIQSQNFSQHINKIVDKYLVTKHKHKLSNYVIHLFMRLYAGFSHKVKIDSKNQIKIITTLCKLHLMTAHISKNEKVMHINLTSVGKKLCKKYLPDATLLHKQLHHKDIVMRISGVIGAILVLALAGVFFVGAFTANVLMAEDFLVLLAITGVLTLILMTYVYHIINPNRINQEQLINFVQSNTQLSKHNILFALGQSYYRDLKNMKKYQYDYSYKFFRR